MALDRDELAARATTARAALVSLCEALSALVPVAPASGAPAPEPRRTVGAVVRWIGMRFIVVAPGEDGPVMRDLEKPGDTLCPASPSDAFVRWATREECERHGIPYVAREFPRAPLAAPSRPEWVQLMSDYNEPRTRKVVRWEDGKPVVMHSNGLGELQPLNGSEWEPCSAPSPAATPAAWVPSVGDVVHGLYCDDTLARITYVAPGGKSGRATGLAAWCKVPDVDVGFTSTLRRATSSERAAAGLPVDESAVDRVALAKAIRVGWIGNTKGISEWNDAAPDRHDDWLRAADAAIAFMAKGGAK